MRRFALSCLFAASASAICNPGAKFDEDTGKSCGKLRLFLSRNFSADRIVLQPQLSYVVFFSPFSPHFLLIILAAVARRARASPQIKTAGGSVVIAVEDGMKVGYKVCNCCSYFPFSFPFWKNHHFEDFSSE